MDPDFGRLKSYRTLEDQLAKLMGNLERLRRELLMSPTPEREAEIKAEMRSRKDECKRYRANGVVPAVGPVVFNQMDLDKDRFVNQSEMARVFKGLKHVYDVDEDEMEKVIEKMFAGCTDERGVTETVFVATLKKLPDLESAMVKDMDPDWGRLRSYRTCEDQLAKLMGNLERLRRELLTSPAPERKAAIETEMRSRKEACKKLRKKGIIPSVGPVVFNQMDLDKDRFVSESEASRTFKALKHVYKIDQAEMDKVMGKLFKEAGDARGITEAQFVDGLKKLPDLEQALAKDIDPDWGRLRSFRGLEDQLAKLYRNIEVIEAAGDESKAEELASRKAQALKLSNKGVVPNPGSCVFFQFSGGDAAMSKAQLTEWAGKVGGTLDDTTLGKIFEGDSISEQQWLDNLPKVPELMQVLVAAMDSSTGRVKA
jgi:uncharacterized tellurite resistance protein B-like protein